MFKAELHHHENLNLKGLSVRREAVRAVIQRGDDILLIHSPVNGDYKFPGGGLEDGENHEDALAREILEECGLQLHSIGEKIGLISEFSKDRDPEIEFFQMNSHYYLCEIKDEPQKLQKLDAYEKELRFTPIWLTPQEALVRNKKVLQHNPDPPKWTRREILFLEHYLD